MMTGEQIRALGRDAPVWTSREPSGFHKKHPLAPGPWISSVGSHGRVVSRNRLLSGGCHRGTHPWHRQQPGNGNLAAPAQDILQDEQWSSARVIADFKVFGCLQHILFKACHKLLLHSGVHHLPIGVHQRHPPTCSVLQALGLHEWPGWQCRRWGGGSNRQESNSTEDYLASQFVHYCCCSPKPPCHSSPCS